MRSNQPPMGLFSTYVNEHSMVKNPNWEEADQLAISKLCII